MKVEIKDLLDYEIVGNIKQVGSHIIVSKRKMNEKDNNYDEDLYYVNEDLTVRPLTSSHHVSDFVEENEHSILFADSRQKSDEPKKGEKKTVYYRLSLEGGEATQAYEFPYNVLDIKLFNHYIVLMIEENIQENKEEDYIILHEVPFVANGSGFVDSNRVALILYDLDTKEYTRITEQGFDTFDFDIQDNIIYYSGVNWHDVCPQFAGLYSYSVDTKETSELIDDHSYRINSFTLYDQGIYCIMSDMKEYDTDQYDDIYFFDFSNNSLDLICKYPYPMMNAVCTDAGSRGGKNFQMINGKLHFISTQGYKAELYCLEGNEVKKVLEFDSSICSYVYDQHDLYFIGMEEGKLPEIYHYFLGQSIIHSHFSDVLENKDIQKVNYIPFMNRKGMKIDAWIIYPVNYEEGKLYPAILDIHGGPKAAYSNVFYHEMQVWANEGYFVYFCNPQGSDGYGQEFGDMRMQYGTKDYDDLMDLTDYILTNYPSIDSTRLGVTGGSYGGYMTNWIVTHTDRFASAATQRSISDWVSDYGTSGISYDDGLHKHAAPWNRMEDMWQSSPLKYANQCHTPLLFIHSFEDYTCAVSQAYEFFTALKILGVETKAVLFKGENHGLSVRGKPSHRFKRLSEITEWMNIHLKKCQ